MMLTEALDDISVRVKPLVRLHPELHSTVKDLAEIEGVTYNRMLEEVVRLGLSMKIALRQVT